MSDREFNDYKLKTQDEFKNNKFPLLVATKAFGMGIDKPNIRYTIHFGMPGSLESLYQEAGRAGRDGNNANCYVIHTKEIADPSLIEKMFEKDTTVEQIDEIQKEIKYDGRDIFENFFLWLGNNKGVGTEVELMKKVFYEYAVPNKVGLIECRRMGVNLPSLQKAIYRLSVIGIVDFWYVENWNSANGILEVNFADYTEQTVEKNLSAYIKKYDVERAFEQIDGQYKDRLFINVYEKYFHILLDWTYDNIVYNRRQSIKTIYERCENFTNSEDFKREIDNYFKYSDKSILLDNIAFNQINISDWFAIFYNVKGEVKEFITSNEINEIRGSLSRYLESSKQNTGLNYISGIIRLLIGDYMNPDGRARLESAFKAIRSYDEIKREEIFLETLIIGTNLDNEKNKQYLSELLCSEYSGRKIEIYKALQDNFSLFNVLTDLNRRAERIWVSIND